MPLFTLPLTIASGQISRSHSTSKPTSTNIGRKRKRAPSPPPGAQQGASSTRASSAAPFQPAASSQPSQPSQRSSPAPSEVSTHIANPLSLNDAERAQYLLAGLPLDTELPSTTYTSFPSKSLPEDAIIEDGGWTTAGEQTDVEITKTRETRGSYLKLRHLGVLTAIVQRCLLEGDIQKATKAWSLLLRAQVGGRGLDLRSTAYWGIGAELLIRSGQARPLGKRPLSSLLDHDEDSDREHDNDDELRKRQQGGPPSWGTKEGIAAAKEYYERLILQHPYLRQFADVSVSSLDFWPAMLSCEVYGVQQEFETSMATLSTQDSEGEKESEEENDEDSLADDSIDPSDPNAYQNRMEELEQRRLDRMDARRELREKEKEWTKKEPIRRRALEAATSIATRMDELMTGPPWTDSSTLLRLRGCVALWVGDISVPTPWTSTHEDDEDQDSCLDKLSRSTNLRDQDRARREEDRKRDYEHGKSMRHQYRLDARNWFQRAEKRGARCPDVDLEEGDEDETERTF